MLLMGLPALSQPEIARGESPTGMSAQQSFAPCWAATETWVEPFTIVPSVSVALSVHVPAPSALTEVEKPDSQAVPSRVHSRWVDAAPRARVEADVARDAIADRRGLRREAHHRARRDAGREVHTHERRLARALPDGFGASSCADREDRGCCGRRDGEAGRAQDQEEAKRAHSATPGLEPETCSLGRPADSLEGGWPSPR